MSTCWVWHRCLAATGPWSAGAARPVPTGVLYSVVLLLHVLCAVVGFGATVTTGVQAARLGRRAAVSSGVRRYFRAGTNWPARTLYGVPVFGYLLVATSSGAFSAGDGFVLVGLTLWAAAAVVAELSLWPGERRIQRLLAQQAGDGPGTSGGALEQECRRVATAAGALAAVFVAAVVVMVARP